jgi:hypothetical protein
LHRPAASLVELAQIYQQPIDRSVKVRCLFRDPFAQLIQLAVHDAFISFESDTSDHQQRFVVSTVWTLSIADEVNLVDNACTQNVVIGIP